MNIYNEQQTRQTKKFGMAVQKKVVAFINWVVFGAAYLNL